MKKILGLVLLFSGLIIILYSLYSSYNIFSGKAKAPEIFKIEKKETALEKTGNTPQISLENEVRKLVGQQVENMIPSEFISQILNMISWSIFIGILVLIGGKISAIGIGLLR